MLSLAEENLVERKKNRHRTPALNRVWDFGRFFVWSSTQFEDSYE